MSSAPWAHSLFVRLAAVATQAREDMGVGVQPVMAEWQAPWTCMQSSGTPTDEAGGEHGLLLHLSCGPKTAYVQSQRGMYGKKVLLG